MISDVAAAEYVPIGRDTLPPLFDGTDRSITFVRTAFAPNAAPSLEIVRIGVRTLVTDTVMRSLDDRVALAREVVAFAEALR